ncbi:hypothetical protein [Streptomyces sp. NPDC005828]|uniref:hypothetical protein n=1 Tax=Streptomyces sp. NPDC005828 TaxID=3157071 RepID=UPI0033FF2079
MTATGSLLSRTARAVRTPATWHPAFLYAVSFGGFVAFGVYLPTCLTRAYELGRSDAALRTAGFVVLAVAMRPLGGRLSDRTHPVPVLTGSYGLLTVTAVIACALTATVVRPRARAAGARPVPVPDGAGCPLARTRMAVATASFRVSYGRHEQRPPPSGRHGSPQDLPDGLGGGHRPGRP